MIQEEDFELTTSAASGPGDTAETGSLPPTPPPVWLPLLLGQIAVCSSWPSVQSLLGEQPRGHLLPDI